MKHGVEVFQRGEFLKCLGKKAARESGPGDWESECSQDARQSGPLSGLQLPI